MKLHTLSSLVKIERSKIPSSNKVTIRCTDFSVTKTKMKKILANYTSVCIISINSVNSIKKKKATSQVLGEKYTRVYSFLKQEKTKKFILSFKHSADRNLFLGDIGVE